MPVWQDAGLVFIPDVRKQPLKVCLTGAVRDEPPVELRSALTEDQDFGATTTPAAWGTARPARGALATDLNSAVHT
jgi:hypothetical protein